MPSLKRQADILTLPGRIEFQVGKALGLLANDHAIGNARTDQQVGRNQYKGRKFFVADDPAHGNTSIGGEVIEKVAMQPRQAIAV